MHAFTRTTPAGLGLSCLLLSVLFAPTWSAAQDGAGLIDRSAFDYAAIAASVDETTRRMQAVRADIDRARFDPEALIDALDYDADTALAFVREEIVFQPYEGALRGVVGTLRARAGNSLDQSILLASLLKSTGYDARVVRGTLGDADALRLLRGLKPATRPASLAYLEASLAEHTGAGVLAAPGSVDVGDTAAAAGARALVAELKGALSGAGIMLAPVVAEDLWLAVARRYFWVQHRAAPTQPWQDAHPAFGGIDPPATIAPEEYFQNAVPETYQHTLTVAAFVEQWSAGKITRHALMSPWTRPIANLDAVPISYRNQPGGLSLANAGDLEVVGHETQLFIPMFNEARAPGAMAFDLKGRVIDPMALAGGSVGIFKTMGDLMERATGDVMDRPDGEPVSALHSMWLEFTFTAPGGETSTERRYVVAPRSDHSEAAEKLLWPLLTQHVYMVNAGGQPLDYLADRYLATAIENGAWLKAIVHKFLNPDEGTPVPDNDLPADFPPLAQYWFMDDNPLASEGVVSFRAKPGLLGLRRGFLDADTAFAGVDVVANRVEHLRVTGTGIEAVPAASLDRGVWETVLEALPQKVLSVEAAASASAVEVFNQAREQGLGITVLKPGEMAAVDALGLDSAAAGFLRTDLERGYAVLVPRRVPAGVAQAGWWRVDPVSGETLGLTGDGHGQDMVEYLTNVAGIAFNMVQALQALKDCEKQDNDVAKMCCLVEANINNVAGLGFGSLLGSVVGTAGGALFDILNYGTQMATQAAFGQAQGLMPQAKLGCDKMQATAW